MHERKQEACAAECDSVFVFVLNLPLPPPMSVANESSVPVFDTHKYVRKLTHEGGVGEKQADAHTDALQDALQGISTKADIKMLKARLTTFETKMDARLTAFETKMDARLTALETNTEMRFENVERNAQWDRRFLGTGFVLLSLLMVALRLF